MALGRADVGELESLIPREPGLTVIGGSSDHCIVDVEDCPRHLEVGDVVEFSAVLQPHAVCHGAKRYAYQFQTYTGGRVRKWEIFQY